jgi:hypothetical protein
MIALELFVPLAGNDGATFTPAHHAAFEAELLGLFGGFSRLPGSVEGAWLDAGVTYRDALVVYLLAVPSITAGDKVCRAADIAKAHYGQLAVFVRYLGVTEIL